MFLSPAELTALTGKRTKRAQRRALAAMRIAFEVRPDGSAAVLRSHIEKRLDGSVANAIKEEHEPDWRAI